MSRKSQSDRNREMDITIRKAKKDDVRFVAWTVLTALDLDDSQLEKTMQSCADTESLYSWTHALIAEDSDGTPQGCIVSYRGDDYMRMREHTWPTLWTDVDPELVRNTPPETQPGEYYLDSMAIVEESRGHDFGKRLMQAAIEEGRRAGYRQFALIVDIDKPRLRDYYTTLGFQPDRELQFLTHRFTKMALNIN